eukprot:2101932-Pyramimonas_sp.AAC.2
MLFATPFRCFLPREARREPRRPPPRAQEAPRAPESSSASSESTSMDHGPLRTMAFDPRPRHGGGCCRRHLGALLLSLIKPMCLFDICATCGSAADANVLKEICDMRVYAASLFVLPNCHTSTIV